MKIIQTIEKMFWRLIAMVSIEHTLHLVLVFLMPILNILLFTRQIFSTTNIKDLSSTCIENLHIFLLSFLKNVCFTLQFILLILDFLDFFPRFNSHFRLVQMTLKSKLLCRIITLFSIFTIIARVFTICFILSVCKICHCVNT